MDPDPQAKVTHEYLQQVMRQLSETLEGYNRAITDLQNRQRQDDYDHQKQQQIEQTVQRLEREMQEVRSHGQREESDQNSVENDIRRLQNDLQQLQRTIGNHESKLRKL